MSGDVVKCCAKCGKEKSVDSFPVNKRYAGGFGTWCRDCHRQANKDWYQKNKEKQNKKSAAWACKNKDAAKSFQDKWRERNKEVLKKQHAEWRQKNLDKCRLLAAKRKAARLKATPSWAEHEAIREVYRKAVELQKQTGVRKHVDHIVPLQSKFVCGLHVVANLQILDGADNERKKNYVWPDMP